MSTFSDFADWSTAERGVGPVELRLPPNCGVGMAVMCDKETKEYRPVTAF
jgi:hypothetical protein